ncbi:hypothetical protein [Paraburkholderia sp. A3RO-2L]|uniref:hypothetical protein n=1 Tax=unclassified Paraburkholderia TaxID=2615204 RepID=UPI003DA8D986
MAALAAERTDTMCQGTCTNGHAAAIAETQLLKALADIKALAEKHYETAGQPEMAQKPEVAILKAITARAEMALRTIQPTQRIAVRAADGPIAGHAITERMMAICGCKGAFACQCVTVENQARRELWAEYNERLRQVA